MMPPSNLRLGAIASLMMAMITGCASAEPSSSGSKTLVYRVNNVKVRVMESSPEQIQIVAEGMTRTGGWTAPELRKVGTGRGGILEFEFVARAPQGNATDAISPISASLSLSQPAGFRGVRVMAEMNSQTEP